MMNRLTNVYGLMVGTLAVWALAVGSSAALELPEIFSDHMVLQRDMPVPVWGKAQPGERVVVSLSDVVVGQTKADAQGEWRVDLPAMSANDTGQVLAIASISPSSHADESSAPVIQFTDVLVGDVWHCSGQSNMQWPVAKSNDAQAQIAAADYPLIRHFTQPRKASDTPLFTNGGTWQVVSPDNIGDFSAVAYYFGRKLHASQGVPVGLFATSWGGAAAEAFTSIDTIQSSPITASYLKQFAAREPDKQRDNHTPAKLYNGLIHPVAPFAHRGVIWYQGEANAGRGPAYRTLLANMIEDWRSLWDQPGSHRDTPFLIVQLANYKQPADTPPARDHWGELRDSQAAVAASVQNAYIMTAIDIGEAGDIHPRNKQDVGLRLARLAERYVYGDEGVVPVGPTFVESEAAPESGVVVRYDFASGLTTDDGEAPRGFAIRPSVQDGAWVWADAEIVGEAVHLSHPEGLAGPFEVRYAYGINPADGPQGINLVNGEGLPAMPFRTDAVPGLPTVE